MPYKILELIYNALFEALRAEKIKHPFRKPGIFELFDRSAAMMRIAWGSVVFPFAMLPLEPVVIPSAMLFSRLWR